MPLGRLHSWTTGVSGEIRPSGETATKPLGTRLKRFGNQLERRKRGRRRDFGPAEPGVERARELRVADPESSHA